MLTEFSYNGNTITRNPNNGFINANEMAKASNNKTRQNKRLDNFMRLKSTHGYIKALQNSLRCEVVQINQGNTLNSGTWMHPMLAIEFAQWLDIEFKIWCNAHLLDLIVEGSTNLGVDVLGKYRGIVCTKRANILNENNSWDDDEKYYLPWS